VTPPDASTPELHPDVAELGFLLGTWAGQGEGRYPTIAPFAYGEEIRVWHVGKPFLAYVQRTWSLGDGRPLHGEAGYWRRSSGGVELVIAHPTGIVEVDEGGVEGTHLMVSSTAVVGTSSAKAVAQVVRQVDVEGSDLTYRVSMAAVGQPLQEHLRARLVRV